MWINPCNMSRYILKKVMFIKCVPKYNYLSKYAISSLVDSNKEPEIDIEFLCNPDNRRKIELNIVKRKGIGNINRVIELYQCLQQENLHGEQKLTVQKELYEEARMIPNMSHPPLEEYDETPRVMKCINDKRTFSFQPKEFNDIAVNLKLIRTENLGNFCGQRSYYLLGELAELEQALIRFCVHNLLKRNFQMVSVPDILPRRIIESCGMDTRGPRTQVYELDPELHEPDLCLSGTSEMALAGLNMNKVFDVKELPLKFVAASRCYRAETSSIAEERGIYRVHQFTKVEMFAVTTQEQSASLLEEFREIQEQSFASLGLHIQTLDMPLCELGAPAYRKYDVEGWLPGRQMFGELSSCSNCTDYQARRLNIKYRTNRLLHAHTVNGTACAIPRMLIALFESHQQQDGTVNIPQVLQPYMNGKTKLGKQTAVPDMKFIKSKQWEKKHIKS